MIVTRERRVFRFPSLDPIRYRVPLSRLNQFLHRVDIQSVDIHPLPRGNIGQIAPFRSGGIRACACISRTRGGDDEGGLAYEFSIKPRKFPRRIVFGAASVWGRQFNDTKGWRKGLGYLFLSLEIDAQTARRLGADHRVANPLSG